MAEVEYRRMQQIRGSRAEFEAINPILLDGELAIQQTDRIVKAGVKNRRPWSELQEFTIDWTNIRNIPEQVGRTGEKGDDGEAGKSAYESYLDIFTAEHADDVVDEEHPAAVPLTESEWVASLYGTNGESAFQIAERLGLATGTEEEWIRSLQGADGEKGDIGSPFHIKKIFSSVDEMTQVGASIITPESGTEGEEGYVPAETLEIGDFVIVITEDIEDEDYGKLYIYEGEVDGAETFSFIVDMSVPGATGMQGPQGIQGETGATGLSAYQVYVKNFNEEHAEDDPVPLPMSESEWLESLKGKDGVSPESNYEIYKRVTLEQGETPVSEAEWIIQSRGPTGDSAYEIAVKEGFEGTPAQWIQSLQGKDGTNATITILEGDTVVARVNADAVAVTGDDGRSAYQVAVDRGFIGDEDTWLESLKGADGQMGPQGPQGERGIQGAPGPAIAGFTISKVFASTSDMNANDRFIKSDGTTLTEGEFVLVVDDSGSLDPDDPDTPESPTTGTIYIVDAVPDPEDPDNFLLQFNLIGNMSVTSEFQGPQGERGPAGQSAYDLYLEQFTEDHADDVVDEEHPATVPMSLGSWLESIRGEKGEQGPAGPSAYDSAVSTGFNGSQAEWVASLQGKSAYQSYVDTFTSDDPEAQPLTEAAWVASLKGPKGEQGESAYQAYLSQFDPTTSSSPTSASPMSEADFMQGLVDAATGSADSESVTLLKKQVMRLSQIAQNYKALLEYTLMDLGVEMPANLLPTDEDIFTYTFDEEEQAPSGTESDPTNADNTQQEEGEGE